MSRVSFMFKVLQELSEQDSIYELYLDQLTRPYTEVAPLTIVDTFLPTFSLNTNEPTKL